MAPSLEPSSHSELSDDALAFLVFVHLEQRDQLGANGVIKRVAQPDRLTGGSRSIYAYALHRQGQTQQGIDILRGQLNDRDGLLAQYFLGKIYNDTDQPELAIAAYESFAFAFPHYPPVLAELTHLRLPGEDYMHALEVIHQTLAPRIYFEIGVAGSFPLSAEAPLRIGVDPDMSGLPAEEKQDASLFEMTSDQFFQQQNVPEILGHRPIELAFLDGLHLFEFLLRDFMNTERFCDDNSVVLLHDCIPIHPVVAQRERSSGPWAGDVWKLIPILRKYRPDLKIATIPAPPSGLVMIRGLDPNSRVIAQNYDEIVKEFADAKLDAFSSTYQHALGLIENDPVAIRRSLRI